MEAEGQGGYSDARFLLVISNICETLFFKAAFALGDRQMEIFPFIFGEQLFLPVNRSFSDLKDVHNIVK